MSNRAYYSANLVDFLIESADSVIGKITQNHSQNLEHLQTGAWTGQIEILQMALQQFNEGHILFEAQIPRMGKRADVVFIYKNLIFVIEFKVGAKYYLPQDIRQAHGYAIDLHHFHEGSHNKTIIPILVATEAQKTAIKLPIEADKVYEPLIANKSNLCEVLDYCVSHIHDQNTIDYQEWLKSSYKPTPTIIEAA